MRFAESRPVRPVAQPQPLFPLMCGMCVTAIVTLGIEGNPMMATMLGVLAGAVAVFACSLAMKKLG
jgi:hypothetical protein